MATAEQIPPTSVPPPHPVAVRPIPADRRALLEE